MSPVPPRITDSEASIDAVARAIWVQPLFLKDCARQVFLPWLEKEFPGLYHS